MTFHLTRDSPDAVVGLVPLFGIHRYRKGLEHEVRSLELGNERLFGFFTRGFVVFVDVVAVSRTFQIGAGNYHIGA